MSQNRPNILYIMDDQHRWDYLGSMGADFVKTPNLDRLAERGVQFTQCTTNCPVCAPSRIAVASGLQPVRLGALGNSNFLPRTATNVLSTATRPQLLRRLRGQTGSGKTRWVQWTRWR